MSDTFSFLAGVDDCWANNGLFSRTSQTLFLAKHGTGGTDLRTWIPFVVTMPREVLITSAVVRWYSVNSFTSTVKVLMRCEAADNPVGPVDEFDVLARAVSSASVAYDLESYSVGVQYSYDVTSPVQETLNRAGWVSGNTLALVIDDNGTSSNNRREIASYDNTTYQQAVLEITVPTFFPRVAALI